MIRQFLEPSQSLDWQALPAPPNRRFDYGKTGGAFVATSGSLGSVPTRYLWDQNLGSSEYPSDRSNEMLQEVQVLDWLHLITAQKETRQIHGDRAGSKFSVPEEDA